MNLSTHPTADRANAAAAELLAGWLASPTTRHVMVAAGNTPIELYRRIARQALNLSHLHVYALDEYVGVPLSEPRNCANLLRREVGQAWGIPPVQFHHLTSMAKDAPADVRDYESRIEQAGGLDVVILGLGQNGHLGFNEPGSAEDGPGRLLDLERISIEANRTWFGGDYAPAQGVTVGLKTILASRHILVLAYGSHKTAAVQAMVQGPRGAHSPASFLQGHSQTHVFLDQAAAGPLASTPGSRPHEAHRF